MAAVMNAYPPFMGFQQQYHYPIYPSGYPSQPGYNNYYAQPQMPIQSRQAPMQPQQMSMQPQQMLMQSRQASMQPQQVPMQPQQAPMQSHHAPVYQPQMPLQSQQAPIQQQQQQQQQQPQPQLQVQQSAPAIEYVDSGEKPLRRRREPRIIRQVIVLPTPEPVYRQVRHRMPTPERQVIERTIIQKANGEVVVQQQRPTPRRSQSRHEPNTQMRPTRSRLIYTD